MNVVWFLLFKRTSNPKEPLILVQDLTQFRPNESGSMTGLAKFIIQKIECLQILFKLTTCLTPVERKL
jgi:hypothetical protein